PRPVRCVDRAGGELSSGGTRSTGPNGLLTLKLSNFRTAALIRGFVPIVAFTRGSGGSNMASRGIWRVMSERTRKGLRLAWTSAAEQTRFITDAINSTPDEHLFTGGKSKDGELISDWRWTSGPGVQDKNDIEHAFAAAYTGGTTGTDSIVYFGLDRYAQSGDA